MPPACWVHLGLAAVVLAAPMVLGAQEGGGQARARDTTELVFEREVFNYPAYERKNPFEPAIRSEDAGPRFEDLTLIGLIYSPDPELSVALLAEGVRYDEAGVLTVESGRGGVTVEEEAEPAPQDTAAAGESGGAASGRRSPGQTALIAGTGYQTYRVRQGDQLGNIRILEIQRMRVIVEVEEFGLMERREFVLRTPANRGGQP